MKQYIDTLDLTASKCLSSWSLKCPSLHVKPPSHTQSYRSHSQISQSFWHIEIHGNALRESFVIPAQESVQGALFTWHQHDQVSVNPTKL